MGGCKPQKGHIMRGLYKILIYATIPLAFVISAAAVAIGAALQGIVMWVMIAVAIGAFAHVFVVLELLIEIDNLKEQLRRERYMIEQFGRNTYNYR